MSGFIQIFISKRHDILAPHLIKIAWAWLIVMTLKEEYFEIKKYFLDFTRYFLESTRYFLDLTLNSF